MSVWKTVWFCLSCAGIFLIAMNSAGGVYYVIFGEPWTTPKVVICALISVGLFVWYKMRGAE